MADIEINPQFQQALDIINQAEQHVFITGKAGTGKSTLLDHFCRKSIKKPVVLAPTGVAALNVKGQTIHSFFNFYVDVTAEKIRSKETRPRDATLYKNLTTLIIDEVSMLRADLLDCIDIFLRMYGPDISRPFGGVQMVFVGDLYQLPPVVSRHEKEIFKTHYKTPYFFSANSVQEVDLEIIELEKVYRQKDMTFVDLLNRIRNNSVESKDIEQLNSRYNVPEDTLSKDDFYISLTSTNKRADEINDEYLGALSGKMYESEAVIKGTVGKEYYPTATDLQFKVGSQIMLLNNDQKRRWVNGSIGVVESVECEGEEDEYLNVRLQDTNRLVAISPYSWEVFKFEVDDNEIISEPAGTFTQYPFRLAWAITIHKSQGKTFDNVIIDIGKGAFAAGQIYVALSRCTSFEGVVLKTPLRKRDIRTDHQIYRFLTHYCYRKSEKEQPFEEKVDLIQSAIEQQDKLHMTYLKANDTKSKSVIIPLSVRDEKYRGKQFPGMRALCTEEKEERMFHVGRILSLEKA